MDLSKAFVCIPHDRLIARLDSYGLDRNLLKYINSYLDNRKQCARIINVNSDFHDIISGLPQGSMAFKGQWCSRSGIGFVTQEFRVQNHWVAPRSTQPLILLRLIK